MTIHAHTQLGSCPAFVNLSECLGQPGAVILTVRSTGENRPSSIILGHAQLLDLITDASKYLGAVLLPGAGEMASAIGECVWNFDEFVQYGRDNGANIEGGMPWSFSFHGHPVTHENDQCYLIGHNAEQLRFTPDQVITVNPNGSLALLRAEPLPV